MRNFQRNGKWRLYLFCEPAQNLQTFNIYRKIMDRQVIKVEGEASFHEMTDSFELTVTLLAQQRLIITVKDFVDWIIYSKEYTEDDIGKEINRKMDLMDVYTAFVQTKPQSDEERMKEKGSQGNQLKRYKFGTVIEDMSKKLPCYKIERLGRITIYLSMLDKEVGKEVIYESNLTLKMIKAMRLAEIETEKSRDQKNSMFEELKKKFQEEIREKDKLMIKLEEENDRLRRELRLTRQELIANDERVQIQINTVQEALVPIIEKLKQQLILAMEELKQTKQQLANCKKIKEAKKDFDESEMSSPFKTTKTLIVLPQANSDKFIIDGLKLQYKGDQDLAQFIFNQPINPNQFANFKLKIIKMQSSFIMVGVVDYAQQKEQMKSHKSGNAMCYHSYSGKKFPSGGYEGGGFKQGDVVEVDVDRVTSTIRYIINGVTKAIQTNNMLADNPHVFMPFVEMAFANDCVEWLI